ncbi:hypothetical protein [Natronospora cellulosivora (SeqCode)]
MKKFLLLMVVVLSAFVFLAGCEFELDLEYDLSGKVVDHAGDPIDGVTLKISGVEEILITEFGENGEWAVKGVEYDGTNPIKVEPVLEDYSFSPTYYEVLEDRSDLDFTGVFIREYDVSGTVLDEESNPLAEEYYEDLVLEVTGYTEKVIPVNKNGEWNATLEGFSTVTISHPYTGYYFDTLEYELVGEERSDLDFVVKRHDLLTDFKDVSNWSAPSWTHVDFSGIESDLTGGLYGYPAMVLTTAWPDRDGHTHGRLRNTDDININDWSEYNKIEIDLLIVDYPENIDISYGLTFGVNFGNNWPSFGGFPEFEYTDEWQTVSILLDDSLTDSEGNTINDSIVQGIELYFRNESGGPQASFEFKVSNLRLVK